MRVLLLRHGATQGNLAGRYIGRTEEPLCGVGIAALHPLAPCELLVSSPMLRCVQTARLLFPEQEIRLCDGLRECDFGRFEGKTYKDLTGDPDYQAWIDSGGTMAFPGGEPPQAFRERSVHAFSALLREPVQSLAVVAHGGTVMSVLSAYDGGDFYSYHVENGHGYAAEFEGEQLLQWEPL